MTDVTVAQLTANLSAGTGMDRADAENMIYTALEALEVNMPAGAVAVTDSVAEAVEEWLKFVNLDPAKAARLVMDRVDPEDAGDLSPAAIRDYCRRAAHDMGIVSTRPERLPAIADEVARRIKVEAALDTAARLPQTLAAAREQVRDNGIRTAWNGAGTAVGSVWPAGSSYGVQVSAKDPLDGRPESATGFFSREELEYFRDQITAALEA